MNSRIHRFIKEEWLQLAILLVPVVAALVAMPFATERVPMQWDLHGHVNWYAPKEWGLLVVPATLLVVFGLVFVMEGFDKNLRHPEDGSLTSHGKAVRSIRLAISLLLAAVCGIQIASALGWRVDVGRLVTVGCVLLFAFIGNLFGKLKPNRWVGFRVPWTLRSETVWRKTHRAAGWLWSVSGIVVAVLCLVAPPSRLEGAGIAGGAVLIVVLVLAPLAVAWRAARAEGTPPADQASEGRWVLWLGIIGLSTLALIYVPEWWVVMVILPALVLLAVVMGVRAARADWLAPAGTLPVRQWADWLGIVVLLVVGVLLGHQTVVNVLHAPARKAAQVAAERWLENLDGSRYADAWQATGSHFRAVVSQSSQVRALNKYRKPAGARIFRTLRRATYETSLPRAPAGGYVVVQFDTVFEHQPEAIETVVEILDKNGQWQVDGYFIR